jgi:hypothetical protein
MQTRQSYVRVSLAADKGLVISYRLEAARLQQVQ